MRMQLQITGELVISIIESGKIVEKLHFKNTIRDELRQACTRAISTGDFVATGETPGDGHIQSIYLHEGESVVADPFPLIRAYKESNPAERGVDLIAGGDGNSNFATFQSIYTAVSTTQFSVIALSPLDADDIDSNDLIYAYRGLSTPIIITEGQTMVIAYTLRVNKLTWVTHEFINMLAKAFVTGEFDEIPNSMQARHEPEGVVKPLTSFNISSPSSYEYAEFSGLFTHEATADIVSIIVGRDLSSNGTQYAQDTSFSPQSVPAFVPVTCRTKITF